jgi:hypothetical protein
LRSVWWWVLMNAEISKNLEPPLASTDTFVMGWGK